MTVPKRVLIACEFSAVVRRAFEKRCPNFDVWSCDTEPPEAPGQHHRGDVRDILGDGWDLMIAHPPCKYLASSGARWWGNVHSKQDQIEALAFVRLLYEAPIARIAIENPVGCIPDRLYYDRHSPASQYVAPWWFGHGETKKTGLWLKNLPLLVPTHIVKGREARIHRMSPGPDRTKNRSRTYPGIADAMAMQWGALLI